MGTQIMWHTTTKMLQASGLTGTDNLQFTSNFFPLIIRVVVFTICLMATVFIMPISPVNMKSMKLFKCSLVNCVLRNLQSVSRFLDTIGVYSLFRTVFDDFWPKSWKHVAILAIKIYLALVGSLAIYKYLNSQAKKKEDTDKKTRNKEE